MFNFTDTDDALLMEIFCSKSFIDFNMSWVEVVYRFGKSATISELRERYRYLMTASTACPSSTVGGEGGGDTMDPTIILLVVLAVIGIAILMCLAAKYPEQYGRFLCCLRRFIKSQTEKMATSWCGKGDKIRTFEHYPPQICYDKPKRATVSRAQYDQKRYDTVMGEIVQTLIVPKKTARTFKMQKDDLCRITIIEGSQVGDLNFWNSDNTKERFYSGKTRQLHSTHLKVYDRLWSCLPYLNPMATFVFDTLAAYGIDEDGGSLHDVVGTRCDDYTYKLITGADRFGSCHSYLTEAVKDHGLKESDVHDVWNIFMCTGFTKDTQQYFCKPSPARRGDFIEFVADMNLLVALSTCPQGDVSIAVGQEVPDEKCYPMKVEIFRKK